MISVMGWMERLDEVRLADHCLLQSDTIHNFDKIIPRAEVISILFKDSAKVKIVSERHLIEGLPNRAIIIFSFGGIKKRSSSYLNLLSLKLDGCNILLPQAILPF